MTADEKTCPRCAEQVKAAAVVCRFCGFNFASQHRTAPKGNGFLENFSPSSGTVIRGLVIIGAVFAASQCFGPTNAPSSVDAPQPVALLDAATRQGCTDALTKAQANGIVKQRPTPNRINVDEVIWSRMTASDKTALLALVACDAYGKRQADLALMEYTVAYGWRSGKRVAQLGSAGTTFE